MFANPLMYSSLSGELPMSPASFSPPPPMSISPSQPQQRIQSAAVPSATTNSFDSSICIPNGPIASSSTQPPMPEYRQSSPIFSPPPSSPLNTAAAPYSGSYYAPPSAASTSPPPPRAAMGGTAGNILTDNHLLLGGRDCVNADASPPVYISGGGGGEGEPQWYYLNPSPSQANVNTDTAPHSYIHQSENNNLLPHEYAFASSPTQLLAYKNAGLGGGGGGDNNISSLPPPSYVPSSSASSLTSNQLQQNSAFYPPSSYSQNYPIFSSPASESYAYAPPYRYALPSSSSSSCSIPTSSSLSQVPAGPNYQNAYSSAVMPQKYAPSPPFSGENMYVEEAAHFSSLPSEWYGGGSMVGGGSGGRGSGGGGTGQGSMAVFPGNAYLASYPVGNQSAHSPAVFDSTASNYFFNNNPPPAVHNYGDATPLYGSNPRHNSERDACLPINELPPNTDSINPQRTNYYSLNMSSIPPPQEIDSEESDDEEIPAVQLSPKKSESLSLTAFCGSSASPSSSFSFPSRVGLKEEVEGKEKSLSGGGGGGGGGGGEDKKLLAMGVIGKQIKSTKLIAKNPNEMHLADFKPKNTKIKITPRPIQLFHVNRIDGRELLKIDDSAVKCLTELGTKRVAVVSVCGEYGTGKSFLANLLADSNGNSDGGFTVGGGVRPCTDGVWMWPVRDEDDDNHVFLILDFEGIGDTYKPSGHDQKVFSMALLISSYFIYNSKGIIDSHTIKGLALLSQLAQHMRACGGATQSPRENTTNTTARQPASSSSSLVAGKNYGWHSPSFLWLLRDFSLTLQDEFENPLSPSDYLDAALSDVHNHSNHVINNNNYYAANHNHYNNKDDCNNTVFDSPENRRICQDIKEFFEEKECMTIVSPVDPPDNEEEQTPLKNLRLDQLKFEFRRQVAQLKNYVFKECKHKALQGFPITAFCKLLQRYSDAINEGRLPAVHSTWDSLQHEECTSLKDTCFMEFMSELRSNFEKRLPVDRKILEEGCKELKKKYLLKFKNQAIGQNDVVCRYKTELKERMDRNMNKALAENDRHADAKLSRLLDNLMKEAGIDEKLNKGLYNDAYELDEDMQHIKEMYEQEALGLDSMKDKILTECLNKMYKKGCEIISNNSKMAAELARQEAEEKNASVSCSEAKRRELEEKLMQMQSVLSAKEDQVQQLQADNTQLVQEMSMNEAYRQQMNEWTSSSSPTTQEDCADMNRAKSRGVSVVLDEEGRIRRTDGGVGGGVGEIHRSRRSTSGGMRRAYDSKHNQANNQGGCLGNSFSRCTIM